MNSNYVPDIANNVVVQELKSVPLAAVVAGTDVSETAIGMVGPGNGPVAIGAAAISLLAGGTFTANNTNFTTFTINKRTAGGSPVAIAIGSTTLTGSNATGSATAWVPVPLTVQSGAQVSPGDELTYTVTHGGSGLAVAASQLELFAKLQ